MKTTGLLDGMSWEGTMDYWCAINEGIKAAWGGLHFTPLTDPLARLRCCMAIKTSKCSPFVSD